MKNYNTKPKKKKVSSHARSACDEASNKLIIIGMRVSIY